MWPKYFFVDWKKLFVMFLFLYVVMFLETTVITEIMEN